MSLAFLGATTARAPAMGLPSTSRTRIEAFDGGPANGTEITGLRLDASLRVLEYEPVVDAGRCSTEGTEYFDRSTAVEPRHISTATIAPSMTLAMMARVAYLPAATRHPSVLGNAEVLLPMSRLPRRTPEPCGTPQE